MARLKEKTWADYDAGPVNELTKAELVKAVRRAAKAANQRLLRLERAGLTGGVYKSAQANLGSRRRFKERPEKMTLSQLRAEYTSIREFLSAKTSTVQGQRETDWKRYATAINHGFTGTFEEFYEQIERYFTDAAERLYSSDVLYQAITENRTRDLEEAAEMAKGVEESRQKGAALLAYMKKRKSRR